MKTNANSVRVGNVIEYQNKLWKVLKTAHTMPGKGGAFVQMEMKELQAGTKLNERFRSTENLEVARLEQINYQYLFDEGETVALMNQETFDQISLNKDFIGEQIVFLQDGMVVEVEFHDETPVGIAFPDTVNLEVSETEAVVKGQTAASSNKPATMENGVRVMVPPFIDAGDKIVVRTLDSSYVERVKK